MGIITIFPTSYMTAMSTTAPPSSSAHPRPPLELAKRMQSLQPSATLAMAARASAMKADGIDVIDLSVGEPDFPTPCAYLRGW